MEIAISNVEWKLLTIQSPANSDVSGYDGKYNLDVQIAWKI